MENIRRIIKQFISFLVVSGVGFLIDFSVYYYLTSYMGVPIAYANMISAVPAITWVFIISTRKIFQTSRHRYRVEVKYVIYLGYQAILLILVSQLAQRIYNYLYPCVYSVHFLSEYLNLLCKCLITPITMICNFLVMKFLSEKV